MKYASKTSYFAFFLALKRLILQIFGRQNVLFCIFLNLKTSYFALFTKLKRVVVPDGIRHLFLFLRPNFPFSIFHFPLRKPRSLFFQRSGLSAVAQFLCIIINNL